MLDLGSGSGRDVYVIAQLVGPEGEVVGVDMTEEQLQDFDLPSLAADDCHLFCWATQKYLPMAWRLVHTWGFRYVCTFVWHKPGGFQAVGPPPFNCEFVVYARRDSPKFVDTKDFFTCFTAPRREHNPKLGEFYAVVKRVTAAPRIDVFSRERRDGFAQFGNGVDKLASAMAEVSKDKGFIEKTTSLGIVPTARGPKEFEAFIKTEVEVNSVLLKDSGFKPE